jgi:Family of unknown function (DUF6519)
MPSDVSRLLFQPRKHYADVRLQQGRVLLDSDMNEGAKLRDEDRRRAALDMIGPTGSPDEGFSLGVALTADSPVPAQTDPLEVGDALTTETVQLGAQAPAVIPLTLRAGTMYVGGHRLVLEQPEPFVFQRDFLQLEPPEPLPQPDETGAFNQLYYLEAWEQAVSAVEDPEIAEPMLRGPDASTRVRAMRRARLLDVDASITSCEDAFTALEAQLAADNATVDDSSFEVLSNGRLRIAFAAGPSSDTCAPCAPNQRRYLGDENAALRIMLTDPGHFVWASNDATPLFAVRVTGLDGTGPIEIQMLTPPANEDQIPLPGQVVEILPFAALLGGGDLPPALETGHFKKVAAEVGAFTRAATAIDPGTLTFTVEDDGGFRAAAQAFVSSWDPNHPAAARLNTPAEAPGVRDFYMRLWHIADDPSGVQIPTPTPSASGDPTGPSLGDTGVIPVFVTPGRRGDFWVAALRVDTPGLVVPYDLRTEPAGVPPHGPHHFVAPLALLTGANGVISGLSDCRVRMRKVTDDSCITVTVGDGIASVGDQTTIQAAIDSLPSDGGRIAVRPGIYPETLLISGRSNVSIEGCGDATIIQSPFASPPTDLIAISSSSGITLTGLTIDVANQRGIVVSASTDVSLKDLAVTAGVFQAGGFVPGALAAEPALIEIDSSLSVKVDGVICQTFQRPALLTQSAEMISIRNLSASGHPTSGPAPADPLLTFVASRLVSAKQIRLQTFGQVGVAVRDDSSEDIDLSDLQVVAGSAQPPAPADTRSAVDIEAGQRISLSDCQIQMEASFSEHAGIVIQGNDVVVTRNRVQADVGCVEGEGGCAAVAWGGIQIRGGSERIEIRRNQIAGGVGHGITIGSVLWRPRSSPLRSPTGSPFINAARREGAGRAQLGVQGGNLVIAADIGDGFFDDTSDDDFLPLSEGPIVDLIIEGNRIEQMFSNGISVLTVLGFRNLGGDLIEVVQGRIEGNTVTGNLQFPGEGLPVVTDLFPFPAATEGNSVVLQTLPFGAIVLAAASGGIDIRNNRLVDNGSSTVVPTNGVFILIGDGISIAGNRITNNGGFADPTVPLDAGIRAGIGVMLAGTGGAGTLAALSPVLQDQIGSDPEGSALRVVDNVVIQPEGRALHAVATGPIAVEGNYLCSLGFHGAENQIDRFAIGDVVYLQDLGGPWERFGVAALSPGDATAGDPDLEFLNFDVPGRTRAFLTNSAPASPRLFAGEGGAILFANNQVTYDFTVRRLPPPDSTAPLSFFPVALLGLDHVGVTSNQFGMRLQFAVTSPPLPPGQTARILGQVLAIGATVNASRNRCASGVGAVVLSLITFGEIMSILAVNQTTHQNACLSHRNFDASDSSTIFDASDANQVLLMPSSPPTLDVAALVQTLSAGFVKLLQVPNPADATSLQPF